MAASFAKEEHGAETVEMDTGLVERCSPLGGASLLDSEPLRDDVSAYEARTDKGWDSICDEPVFALSVLG